ncbi:EAL and HDOD domain-containing protein [Thauera linaloolentis]|uniref:Signal transduction protein n=1 Tax=Thauera linaloolentis (strain DSM 12138 / JCM 21573 / CCUG 41526 / CIP 105981 / IAM 15112 / NBRC 102519 / 47Lol) TaxID=1123367 RepID=N6Y708_THAL4|nr:HDOD domain-containing protein [Thauera linaloolentis]ENO87345.1 signal transduction protein [Thauera linaloolentis 47Lol = DSM 12138]MCM8565459.1 HDOD domain-containing protein [Thauera linaloolentis]
MLKAFLDWLLGRRHGAARAGARAADPQDFEQLNRNAPLREAAAGEGQGEDGGAIATYLCREAVLGRDQRITGYQFMLHEGTRNRIRHSSRRVHHLYAEVLVRNLVSADIGRLLGHRVAFIDVPDSFLSHPCLADLPAQNIVLVPTPHAEDKGPQIEVLGETMARLRQAGFRFGLPDPMIISEFTPLLPLADAIILRAPTLDARRGLQLSRLLADAAPQARLLVRDLPSLEDFRFAFKMGASLFQGPFITSREDWAERDLGPNTARIATLIGRLRTDGDTREISALLKQDGALSLRLLRYVNSAASTHPEPIASIEHALAMLGHDRLYRWLVLLACSTDGSNGRAAAALETALVRARMMELLAEEQPLARRESLFLVGLLSLADVIMQVPLDKALAPLALAPEVTLALKKGEGPLSPLLELAMACERGNADREHLQQAAERCGVTPDRASHCHIQALLWAMDIQQ